jgi:hypothetical protein
MNAGLSNLATLKGWLLADAMQTATEYDTEIVAIGRGVVGIFEQFCARKFARLVGDTFDCPANRWFIVLPRYPIETVTASEIRLSGEDAYEALTASAIVNKAEKAGILYFDTEPGYCNDRVRFTYTGGYFFEQLEPADVGYPTAQPVGSTAVPDELLLAWRLQCEHIWKLHDKLGLAIAQSGAGEGTLLGLSLPGLELLPLVKQTLDSYRRLDLMK